MKRVLLIAVLVGVIVVVLLLTSPANANEPALPGDQLPGEPTPPIGIKKAPMIPVGERPQVTVQTSTGPVTIEKVYDTSGLVNELAWKPPVVPGLQKSAAIKPGFAASVTRL